MAVVAMLEFANATLDQYDEVIEKMGLTDGKAPPHALFHVCGSPEEGGLRVVDVWESAEAFQEFADTQIVPTVQAAGITEAPKVTVWPVHNTLTPSGHIH